MARPKLRSPDQPLPVRWVLGLYEFCASLQLAVILILSAAAVLATATFVESKLGLRAVHFGIYGTWWFTLLNALLALNIFCAAAIRYPWKRHQTGFVITHIGLLTLLFGMLLSRRGGIDAQMPVLEGQTAWKAYEDSENFQLTVRKTSAGKSGTAAASDSHTHDDATAKDTGAKDGGQVEEVITIPFAASPFNWDELDEKFPLPWKLARVDRGVLYDEDGIKLEVLDYYSDSREVDVPSVELALSTPQMPRQAADGSETKSPVRWVPVKLEVKPAAPEYAKTRPYGIGSRENMGGGALVYWLAASPAEVEGFLQSAPEGEIGASGQAVIWAGGQRFVIPIDERLGKGPLPLGETGFTADVTNYYPTAMLDQQADDSDGMHLTNGPSTGEAKRPAVEIRIARSNQSDSAESERLVLFAGLPEVSQQAYRLNVFGSYWFNHGEKSAEQLLRGEGGSRIDLLESPDGKLYYRYWNRKELVVAAELPEDGKPVDAFKMPVAQLQMKVKKHLANDKPGKRVLPIPFDLNQTAKSAVRAAKVRLTVDDASDEFWIIGPPIDYYERPPLPNEIHTVAAADRSVTLRMPLDEIDVGFRVRLRDFERKLDPGTSQPSHYSSIVDLIGRDNDRSYNDDVLITMNAPIDFSDPTSGRSYRLFQESFRGPINDPSDPIYQRFFRDTEYADQGFGSVLTVNYDPGRGIKYLGCLLVIAGILTMFYMRAYFFKPQHHETAAAPADRTRKGKAPELVRG